MEMETYEDWLEGELLEMGIDWEQDDLDTMEENMMVVGSQEYPPHHSEGSHPLQSPPTIAEKGVEVGNVGGVSFTEDDGQDDKPQELAPPPQTPGLSVKLGGLSVEENECLCSLYCTGVHTPRVGQDNYECTHVQQESSDMEKVLLDRSYIHKIFKKNPARTPATHGLSTKFGTLNVEDDEC